MAKRDSKNSNSAGSQKRESGSGKSLAPLIAFPLLFTLINLYMLNQPMAMHRGK